jgi:DNA-binding transcriptional ArsR family regulator
MSPTVAGSRGPQGRETSRVLLAAGRSSLDRPWRADEPAARSLRALALGPEPEWLVGAASFHRVTHHLLVLGEEVLVEAPGLREELRSARARAVLGELQVVADLGPAAAVLDRAAPGWVVVKGASLGARVYENPVERPAGDLDVVVAPERFADAVEALEAAGARVLDRNWTLLLRERRGQVHLVLPQGTVMDLHWDVLNRGVVREDFSLRTRDLLERAEPVRIGPHLVRTLDAADTVLHLCLHAAVSGGHRVGWLMDVERSLRRLDPDQDELVRRCTQARARAAVGAVLLSAHRLLGAPVQPDVLGRLVGPAVRSVSRTLDLVDPVGGRWDDQGPRAWWTPALRDRGAVHLSPRMRRRLRHPARRTRLPATVLSEATDGATRHDYLSAVTARS